MPVFVGLQGLCGLRPRHAILLKTTRKANAPTPIIPRLPHFPSPSLQLPTGRRHQSPPSHWFLDIGQSQKVVIEIDLAHVF
jgi:hypothetical protein